MIGVIPGEAEEARVRAEECAAYAAERGLKLILAPAEALIWNESEVSPDSLTEEPAKTEAPDGFLLFMPEETCSCREKKLIRTLKERYPGTEIRCLRPQADEKETVATYLAYWPSRSAVDRIRRAASDSYDTDGGNPSKEDDV